MSLNTYIYDESLAPLSYSYLDATATTDSGITIDQQKITHLGNAEYGAQLGGPSPPAPVALFIDDVHASPRYAPAAIEFFNGKLPGRFDVVLYPLPSRPGEGVDDKRPEILGRRFSPEGVEGIEPRTPQGIELLIRGLNNPDWSKDERSAVRSLFLALQVAYSFLEPGPEIIRKRDRWASLLRDLGVVFVSIGRRLGEDEEEEGIAGV